MAPGCAAFWVPDQNAPARGFLAQARSAANAATAARRTPQGSIRLAPDQTDRRSRLPRVFSAGAEARHTPRRPCGLPHGLGVSDPSPCAPPRQAGRPGPIGHSVVGSRQRKFGFPTKLPGRKRPTSGDFSDLRSEARLRPRRPLSLPYGLGGSAPSPYAPPRQAGKLGPFEHSVVGFCGSIRLAPDQTDRRSRLPRVFSAGAEARHTPRRPCGLPHGLGGSAPSPYAPPRQAGRPSPVGHSVVGFCGTARGERAGPVWTKNRSGRALTCVSFPPSQRRAPFRGIHKGVSPLCVLFTLLFAQAKNKPSARTGPGIPCRLRHTSQKR